MTDRLRLEPFFSHEVLLARLLHSDTRDTSSEGGDNATVPGKLAPQQSVYALSICASINYYCLCRMGVRRAGWTIRQRPASRLRGLARLPFTHLRSLRVHPPCPYRRHPRRARSGSRSYGHAAIRELRYGAYRGRLCFSSAS